MLRPGKEDLDRVAVPLREQDRAIAQDRALPAGDGKVPLQGAERHALDDVDRRRHDAKASSRAISMTSLRLAGVSTWDRGMRTRTLDERSVGGPGTRYQ